MSKKIEVSSFIPLIIAIVVGVAAGLFAVLFRYMIDWAGYGFNGAGELIFGFLPGDIWKIFVPALAGFIVGPMTYFLAREAKGHGVPEVMESVALKGGRMRMRVIFVKAIASASSIGSGASVGREGPIVQMGSGIGSVAARIFKMNVDRVKTCVACGAAAGIAATFNAPIAGVFFAQEIILSEFTSATFSLIVISSVMASVVAQMFEGNVPAITVEAYSLNHPAELFFYAFLGLLAAFVGYLFVKLLYKAEDVIDDIKIVPEWFKPVIGGLIIGIIGLQFPQILGVGYETIEAVFNSEIVLPTVLALVFLKLIATSLTLGSGHSGGVFAPSLFIGATLGSAFGLLLEQVFPGIVGNPGAYAIVGMGAVVAGSTQAPITALLIIFEMTRDYRIILPLMIAIVISTLVSAYMSEGTIYTIKLKRRGIDLKAGRDVNVMKQIKVREVMSSPVEIFHQYDSVGNVIEMMHDSKHNGFPVLDENENLVGMITLQDIREAPVEGIMDIPVSNLMSKKVVVTTEFETLDDVFRKLSKHDIGHLPVVAMDNALEIIGFITRSDIIQAYNKKLITNEKLELEHDKLEPSKQS